jgi:hypothetical protein
MNTNVESVTVRRTESSAAKQRSPVQNSASKYKCGLESTAKKNTQSNSSLPQSKSQS